MCAIALAILTCLGLVITSVGVRAVQAAAPHTTFKNVQTGHFMYIPGLPWRGLPVIERYECRHNEEGFYP